MAGSSEEFDLEGLKALVASDPGSPEFPALAEALRRAGDAEGAKDVAERGLEAAPARLAGRVALGLAQLDLGYEDAARSSLSTILDAVLEPHARATAVPEAPVALSETPTREPEAVLPSPALDDQAEWPRPDDFLDATDAPAPGWRDAPPLSNPLRPEITDVPLRVGTEVESVASVELDDDEIDEAFDLAEPQVEEMLSPNHMAERVLLDHAPIDEEAAMGDLPTVEDGAPETAEPSPVFRTETMAELLDRQGSPEVAQAIRRDLANDTDPQTDAAMVPEWTTGEDVSPDEAPERAMSSAPMGERARILSTLERWLHNLQRGQA